jgi:hypothetical protein
MVGWLMYALKSAGLPEMPAHERQTRFDLAGRQRFLTSHSQICVSRMITLNNPILNQQWWG